MKISLERTMVIFAVSIAALPVFVMGVLIWMMNLDVREISKGEFDKIASRTTRQIVDDTLKICRIIARTHTEQEEKARECIRERFSKLGSPVLLEAKTKLRAASQMTPTDMRPISLPTLAFGSSPLKIKLAEDGSIAGCEGDAANILKSLKNDTGLDFAILQRIGENGDMLRVASTAVDEDDLPYVGTYIPANGGYDEGAIVRTLLARKTFTGVSRTGTKNFIVNYEPILDPYGDVIGAFAYGRSQDSVSYLMKYFETIRVGASGYVWAIELAGRGESVVRASRDGKRDGMIVEGDTFKERRDLVLEVINSAVAQGDKVVVREYKLGGERDHSDIITAYTYFKNWNLVIGASAYRSDFDLGVDKIASQARSFMVLLVSVGVGILFFFGLAAWLAALRGVNMAEDLSRAIDKIKNGDIASAQEDLTRITDPKKWNNSEIYRLAVALGAMSENLSSLVAKVQTSGVNLAESAAKISMGASHIDSISSERSTELSKVAATIDSIAKSVVLLNDDAREAAKNIENSLEVMGEGGSLISRLNENAAPLSAAADSVSARLAVIREKTERILASIATINAVGERTNMLSLNAAIESERAADFGGFESVSSEISKLADRMAVSAMDVSKIVADMSGSVDSGVAEMGKFSEKMRLNAEMIRKLHGGMAAAEGRISELGPKFESLAAAISSQEENVSNIGEQVRSLDSFARQTREKVDSLRDVSESIAETSDRLVKKVSQFKLL